MSKKEVCIIILNYKSYDLTINMIKQLNTLLDISFDVVVIDNASPNESPKVLEEYSTKLNYVFIQNSENLGYARGNNIGLKYAYTHGYEYSWIINNDLIIKDLNVLNKLVLSIKNDYKIGAVGPKILDLEGIECAPYVRRESLFDMTLGIKKYSRLRKANIDIEQDVYRVHGCCMLVKNSVMNEINYFDENTFLYEEENILAERLINNGYRMHYNPNTFIIHMESSTTGKYKGLKSRFKRKCVSNSKNYYLKEYRHYNWITRKIAIFVRNLVIYFRG